MKSLIADIANVVMIVVNVVHPMFATLIRAVVGNVMVKGRFT